MDDLISRKAAIELLCRAIHYAYSEDYAVTLALNLPSAQPDLSGYSDRLWKSACDYGYERCRQDAIDAVTAWLHKAFNPLNRSKYNEGETAAYETALSELKRFPSAQLARKKGKWSVSVIRGNWRDDVISICSECGTTFRNLEIANYCPNCGLPMEVEK